MEYSQEFNLIYCKGQGQGILKSFGDKEELKSKIIELEEKNSIELQGMFYSEDFSSPEFQAFCQNEAKFYPIRYGGDFGLTIDNFESLDYKSALDIYTKMHSSWTLQNNISLIEELFKVRQHLQSLWPNDRTGFFEELWFLLKSNLGASHLDIFYNDIIKSKNENEKNKLIKVKMTGSRFPEPKTPNEGEELILTHYAKEFGNIFEVTDYNKQKGQLVICASIKKSPILILAQTPQITRLQKAVISSLFEGLQ